MAETPLKRQREESPLQLESEILQKRHKSFDEILSILEDEEDEPTQDLSDIFMALQRELSSGSGAVSDPLLSATLDSDQDHGTADLVPPELSSAPELKEGDEERVIRHLLEASDDELGIPGHQADGGDKQINGGDHAGDLCDGFWELEDEAANYYALLQSELFM